LPNLYFVEKLQIGKASTYKGQVRQDGAKKSIERHGFGINFWKSGAIYEGSWINNKAQGLGCFWHLTGDIYVGEFEEDQAQGFGIYIYASGSRY